MENKTLFHIVRAIGYLAKQNDATDLDKCEMIALYDAMNILHKAAEEIVKDNPGLIWYLVRWSARYAAD